MTEHEHNTRVEYITSRTHDESTCKLTTNTLRHTAHGLPWDEGRKEMFYLTTHSTHFIYGYKASDIWLRTILIVRKETRCRHIGYSYHKHSKTHSSWITLRWRKEGNVLFNNALNTFYLRLYGVRHMVKDHSDSEKGNPLPSHRLLLSQTL